MKQKTTATNDIAHTTLSVMFIALLIVLCLWLLQPFLMSLVWAAVIVIATWPVLGKIEARLKNKRGLAVGVMTVLMLFVILVPITSAVLTIVQNTDNIAEQARRLTFEPLPAAPDWLQSVPLVGEDLTQRWTDFAAHDPADRSDKLATLAKQALQWFAANAGNLGATVLHLVLTVIIATILYAKGEPARDGMLRFARHMAGQHGEEVTILAAKAVRGVVLGVVVTALIQAAAGGIGLFIAGVPAAGLLTAIMLMLCLAQFGPLPVLVPAIGWLYWSGHPILGTVLLIISIVVVASDNVIRPFLIKKGADLPLLLIFAGVIGGLVAFGIIGLFIGPVILAVTYRVSSNTQAETGRTSS
jgi:predicted PurR-regulated permease PerM